jgi:signal transduction histidine kinase
MKPCVLDDMQTLVQGSLDFMRGMAIQEKSQPLDINSLLESLRDDADDMGHMVSIQGSAQTPYKCKPLALKRCLNNLIDNAIRYGHEADIKVQDDKEQLVITVRDRGPGADRERVFEPFQRLEPSRNPQTGGTGLGLGIARNIARCHGGDITLHDNEGGGLAVRLTLPR